MAGPRSHAVKGECVNMNLCGAKNTTPDLMLRAPSLLTLSLLLSALSLWGREARPLGWF